MNCHIPDIQMKATLSVVLASCFTGGVYAQMPPAPAVLPNRISGSISWKKSSASACRKNI